jgi:glycosyltransferase involved in cell wall biosynthesis
VPHPSVLLVGNFFVSARGGRGVCEDLALQLSAHGWRVITTSWQAARARRLLDMLATSWRARHDYSVAHVDVYSGYGFNWAEIVCLLLRAAGKPYALTLRGGDLPAFGRRWPGRVRRLLRSAAIVTTPSRYLLEQMQVHRADLRLLPNPLGLDRYPFARRSAPGPRLVWLRAFHRLYNPALAPRVLARLAREFPDARLTMVGPDKGDGSLQATQTAAAELGVSDRITFVGGVAKEDVPRRMADGDVFLCTSDIDNTPVSVLEAMACGLCVVATNVGGLPYLLADGTDALLVPPDDPAAMAAAVRRVLRDRALASRLSRNARRKAEGFDWSALLPQWHALLVAASEPPR